MIKKLFLLAILVTLTLPIFSNGVANAASQSLSISMNWNEATCTGSVNGGSQIMDYWIVSGFDLNLTINNVSSYSIDIGFGVNTAGTTSSTTIAAGGSWSGTMSNVHGQLSNATSDTPTGSACSSSSPAALFIRAGSASLTCTLDTTNGGHWFINGNKYNTHDASLFDGSTLLDTGANNSNGYGYIMTAQSAAKTLYFRNGTSPGSSVLTQVLCPAFAAASAGGSSTQTGSQTTNSTSSSTSTPANKDKATANASPTQASPAASESAQTATDISGKSTGARATASQNQQNEKTSTKKLIMIAPPAILLASGAVLLSLKMGWLPSFKKWF